MRYRLVNERTKRILATDVVIAESRADRRRGLLGRDSLDASAALVLKPCLAVHTAFMRFPLDIVFVDADVRVVRVLRDVPPWRIAASHRARAVIEFRGGVLDADGVVPGDSLHLAPLDDQPSSA